MSKRRPSGDGMVRKKEDGRWEGRIVIGHKENGDSIFRYIYAPTQKELTAKLRQEITACQGVDLTEDSKLTLSEWLDYWLDAIMAGTIRPRTLNGYRRYADLYIKPYLGDKQISKITPADVQKMYEVLKARGRVNEHPQYGHQLSGSMVHSIHTMFHGAMKAAEESHIIAKNPTENVPVPKANPKPKQILNDDQLERFMNEIKKDAVWHDFFYTELTTGLRRGELCGLMWADFDESTGTLAVKRTIHTEKGGRLVAGATKTGRGIRNILLPASTAQLLSERKKHSWSEWIFPNPLKPESPTNPRSAYGHLKALLDSAGLPNIRFHDLRHTFATHALASGVDAKTLSGILGHTKASFTLDTYTHVTGDMQQRAADIVGGFMTDFFGVETMAKRRKRGTGSIHLRKDGRWEGRCLIGYDEKGLPKTKNVLAKTKSECIEKLKALQQTLAAPTPIQAKPRMAVREWLDFWYQTHKKPTLRPNTQMSYEQRIYGHIIPALGSIPLDKLTQNELQQFYTNLKQSGRRKEADRYGEGLSDQTVRGCHSTLRSALAKAVEEKLIIRNPADGCRLPSAKPREMQVLTPEEMQRLLIQAKEDGCYELLLLELSTGLRRGEILALQWDDLNFNTGALRVERQVHRVKGELVVSQPKTNSSNRTVILPSPVLKVLKEYRQTVTSRWMFPSPVMEDSPLDPASVRKRLQTVLERAGCKKVRFHDLRHTFATTALEHGMDTKTLSTIIGHVSTSTTLNIYAHVTDEMRRTAAVKIDRGISKTELQKTTDSAVPRKPAPSTFQPYKGQRRKPGTGCVSQVNDKLWEGRFSPIWPDGKKHPRNVYAHSEEECERLLAEMIQEVKAEIAAEKKRLNLSKKAGRQKNPGLRNKQFRRPVFSCLWAALWSKIIRIF